jgi:hypothetical protein
LAITHIIHRAQGLTFDSTNVYKHDVMYITFFHVKNLKKKKLSSTFVNVFFQIDPNVAMDMC